MLGEGGRYEAGKQGSKEASKERGQVTRGVPWGKGHGVSGVGGMGWGGIIVTVSWTELMGDVPVLFIVLIPFSLFFSFPFYFPSISPPLPLFISLFRVALLLSPPPLLASTLTFHYSLFSSPSSPFPLSFLLFIFRYPFFLSFPSPPTLSATPARE